MMNEPCEMSVLSALHRCVWSVVAMVIIVLMCAIIVSCGHDSLSTEVISGRRPGMSPMDKELSDDVMRVSLPDVDMRYDRGGILFSRMEDGRVRVVDLDGADEVTISTGVERTDSVMVGATVDVNGTQYSRMRMMRRSGNRTWYRVTDNNGSNWILVLPDNI